MSRKFFLIIAIIIVIVVILLTWTFFHNSSESPLASNATSTIGRPVLNFYECVSIGYPTTTEYPRQCKAPNDVVFVEDLLPSETNASTSDFTSSESSYKDMVKLINMKAGDTIKSPLHIEGTARGLWYFEGSFPIKVRDGNGDIIGSAIAQAKGEWTTSDYVPFSADISFKNNSPLLFGNLVLERDNPSGMPEHADFWSVPIKFDK